MLRIGEKAMRITGLFALVWTAMLFVGCVGPDKVNTTPTSTPVVSPPPVSPTPTPQPTRTATPAPTFTPTPQGLGGNGSYAHKYALVMSGESRTSQHAFWYRGSTSSMYELLVNKYGFAPEDVYYLFEKKNYSEVDYAATKENFVAAVEAIKSKSTENDLVFFYIVGHGGVSGGSGIYSLADSILYDYEFASLLDGMKYKRMVIVLTPCNSGAFIPRLSGPNRIIMTSVQADEGNSAPFAENVIEAFKNENATVAQVFAEITDKANEWYTVKHLPPMEHPLLDDNGDGVGHVAPLPNGGDGLLAASVSLNS